jgi:GT2 family glycosyltransferase
MNPRIGIVLLTTNAVADTTSCIDSLRKITYSNYVIIVADNASTDGTEERLRTGCPDVEFIQLGRNAGFAAGNNVGIRKALERGSEYVLLLNNDTIVEPNFLEPLVAALEQDPAAACSTGTVCFFPETGHLWYAGGDLVWWRASGFARHYNGPVTRVAGEKTQPVTFVSGCLMLVRRSIFEQLGLLEEKTFLYCEDTEFSLRVASAGHTMLYVPESKIYHKTEHRNQTPFSLYYVVRNRLLVADLGLNGMKRVIAKAYLIGTTLVKMVVWRVRRGDLFQAAKMGLDDYRRGVFFEGQGLTFPYRSKIVAHGTTRKVEASR